MKSTLQMALVLVAMNACASIDTNEQPVDYSFDPLEFNVKVADEHQLASTTISSGQCAQNQDCQIDGATPMVLTCESSSCAGSAEIRLPLAVDLSSGQTLPAQVVQLGVSSVTVKKVAYWIKSDTLNVATPKIDVYVASAAAKDERDATATLVGSVPSVPARATACSGTAYSLGDSQAGSAPVCILTLQSAGAAALAQFTKDYQQKFQFIVHATFDAKAGDPIPTGAIDFFLRPSVSFTVLK